MKRPTIILALMAAVVATAPATAQTSALAGPLAPGEVALHVVAHGETTTPADHIVITATIVGKGATAAEADAAARAATEQVTAALIAAGVARNAIVAAPPTARPIVTAPPIVAPAPAVPFAAPPTGTRPAPMRSVNVAMTVTVAGRPGLDAVTRTLEAQGQSINGKPSASLNDPTAARRAATLAAIARAKVDADDYAAALGMRVRRLVAVSNTAGLGEGIEDIADIFERLGNRGASSDTVVTRATATVDFVLAPR